MRIENVEVTRINPAPYNPRKDLQPGDAEYEKLSRSIQEFDCVEPVVWNERTGHLVGGHQRMKVLMARGDTEVAVSVVDLPVEKEKALNLALNKISGDWDHDKLARVLDDLVRLPDFDVSLTGFDMPEVSELLDRLLPQDEQDDSFDVEDELEGIGEPETQRGDMLELGPHRVLCGDSTNPDDVARLMGERRAQLVFTDPPYAVGYRGSRFGNDRSHEISQDGERHWDDLTVDDYKCLLAGSLGNAHVHSDDSAALYLWFASGHALTVLEAVRAAGWEKRNILVWVKNTFGGSLYAQYKHRYEPFLYCHKRGKSPKWYGPTNEETVWECPKPSKNEGHPTVKPLALAMRALKNSSQRGDLVVDFFLGSGTTLIASERMGRVCSGLELEPRYCDLIRRRYETNQRGVGGQST
jgi:DNA modification methylase